MMLTAARPFASMCSPMLRRSMSYISRLSMGYISFFSFLVSLRSMAMPIAAEPVLFTVAFTPSVVVMTALSTNPPYTDMVNPGAVHPLGKLLQYLPRLLVHGYALLVRVAGKQLLDDILCLL